MVVHKVYMDERSRKVIVLGMFMICEDLGTTEDVVYAMNKFGVTDDVLKRLGDKSKSKVASTSP